jgi:hypothetical protein
VSLCVKTILTYNEEIQYLIITGTLLLLSVQL